MKKLSILILLGMVCLAAIPSIGQKMVPYTFRSEHQADTLKELDLKVLTQVTYANTTSLRLYFKGTQLGESSYLLLEGTDGAKQELRKQDLENWHYSSAYFNGKAVKVSLVAAAGEKNKVHISGIKVGEPQTKPSDTARISSEGLQAKTQSASATSASFLQENPHARAVGRFTDGTNVTGTGWIAANGAIITDYRYSIFAGFEIYLIGLEEGYDIIEFNVPPSNPDGSFNHPAPEYQFAINKNKVLTYLVQGNKSSKVDKYNFFQIKTIDAVTKPDLYGGATILEALPNGTGLRPGEMIGEYFQVIKHPKGSVMEEANQPLETFYYGYSDYGNTNYLDPTKNKTLMSWQGDALDPGKWLQYLDDKDRMIVFDLGTSRKVSHYMEGGPMVYAGTNIAVGIHTDGGSGYHHDVGTGFRDDVLRQHLSNFFSSKTIYVDQATAYHAEDGEIGKPYATVNAGAASVVQNGILSIAKGHYNESVTINRPMTLKAPVGKVVIGASGANARTAAGPSLPRELFMDDEPVRFNNLAEEELEASATLVSYPNPFIDRTELRYSLPEETAVRVTVYDVVGNEIGTLLQSTQQAGNHSVVWDGRDKGGKTASTGMYIIKLQTGTQIRSVRVLKK